MNNELLKLESKELRITSMELVDIINQFREEEFRILKEKGLNNKDKYTELLHKSFMTKIKKELETLKTLGLDAELNFKLESYADKNGQQRPCYTLNRDGMLQMLNSESAIVRAKTINYINKLEQNYTVKFDQEFKAHIYTDFNPDNEISYKDLSTGQRKTLDVAIIFGILQNIIANVKCNVIFLDELMSNMDSD